MFVCSHRLTNACSLSSLYGKSLVTKNNRERKKKKTSNMGKYMKKSKITGDIAVMELSQSSMGVRTRAKTLALQRLQKSSPQSPTVTQNPDTTSYLQLRSRRLEKSPPPLLTDTATKKHPHQQTPKDGCKQNPNPNCRASSRLMLSSVNSGSVGSVSLSCSKKCPLGCLSTNTRVAECKNGEAEEDFNDVGFEAFFGENNLEFEGRDSTRESTPCSFIRECDVIGTPGSTTRPTSSTATNQRVRSVVQRNMPTSWEMEEFFACAEQQQQRLFTEKYNFDFVNNLPLPGRYDWVSTNP